MKEEDRKNLGETTVGMPANMAGLLCYFLGLVTGVIFFLVERKNKFVRFHAIQSILLFGSFFIINIILVSIPPLGVLLGLLLSFLSLFLWVFLMIKAYQGELFKLPVLGDFAERKA